MGSNLAEYAPFQSTNKVSMKAQSNVDHQSPAGTATTQDPYYSNQDIEILHEIVAVAQEKLGDRDEPPTLPATALFKAYDEVLPKHGIDPDDENHLSRLIFRVGGEKGHGSLAEKFQLVLASMGVSLEFGEETASSFDESRSSHSYFSETNHDELNLERPMTALPRSYGSFPKTTAAPSSIRDHDDKRIPINQPPSDDFMSATSRPPPRQMEQNVANEIYKLERRSIERPPVEADFQPYRVLGSSIDIANVPKFAKVEEDIPVLRSPLSRPPLLAILDRWRTASNGRKSQTALPPALLQSDPAIVCDSMQVQGKNASRPTLRGDTPGESCSPPSNDDEPSASHDAKQPIVWASVPTTASANQQRTTPREDRQDPCHPEYAALLHRAERARQIYLASRAFNHWADKTAVRLEKEAVARRHMIRFRCFLGWSQAPNLKLPTVDHLRAVTAIQKLQRAVACQEEQLQAAASALAQTYRVKTAMRAISRWLCSATQESIRRNAAHETRRDVARSWKRLASIQRNLAESTAKNWQKHQKKYFTHYWASQAQQTERQLVIMRHIGLNRPMFTHLCVWLDHTEVEKTAHLYRANKLLTVAHASLSHWNLRARAQAFVWRSDYKGAIYALNSWTQATKSDRTQRDTAAVFSHQYEVSATLYRSRYFADYVTRLDYYTNRARLYIMAKRFLHVLDHTYEVRKASRKDEIRQQLRSRYREASSARKKRKFHLALDLWRSLTRHSSSLDEVVEQHDTKYALALKLATVRAWRATATQHREQHEVGKKYALHAVLIKWTKFSNELTQEESQSWNLWMHRQQRHTLKVWSISSLQGSGRAHTAMVVRQRYQADRRNRAFEVWRLSYQGSEDHNSIEPSATPGYNQGFSARSNGRTLSSRKPIKRYPAGPQNSNTFNNPAANFDTPTRWTSKALAMSRSLTKPMPPVRETDEQSATASSMDDEADINHHLGPEKVFSHAGLQRNQVLRSTSVDSTTPRAPVPSTRRRSIYARNPAIHKSTPSTLVGKFFQPSGSVLLQQGDASDTQLSGYEDASIQTVTESTSRPVNQHNPTLNLRGPVTPSPGIRAAGSEQDPKIGWRNTAKTAPQPSRFTSPQYRHLRPVYHENQATGSSARRWN